MRDGGGGRTPEEAVLDEAEAPFEVERNVDVVEGVADSGGCGTGGPAMVDIGGGWTCMGIMTVGRTGPSPGVGPFSVPSGLFALPPLFLGRLVPGGASRLTVQ